MVLHHHHHRPTPQLSLPLMPGEGERCRHHALQTFVETVCLDCQQLVSSVDQMTGLAVNITGLPVYTKP